MTLKTKSYVFTVFFSTCVILPLLLPNFTFIREFINSFDIFSHDYDNFIFLMVAFVFISYILTELSDYTSHFILRMYWQTPKIGQILVSQGTITREELDLALKEQGLRIGEFLAQNGRITSQQLQMALAIQKKTHRLLGEILIELGFSKADDIRWALYKTHRRVGKILREKNLISDYDLVCAMTLKKCRMHEHGCISDRM